VVTGARYGDGEGVVGRRRKRETDRKVAEHSRESQLQDAKQHSEEES
jgi:hypothetical protein